MLFPEPYCSYEGASLTNEEVISPLERCVEKQCLPYEEKGEKSVRKYVLKLSGYHGTKGKT